MIALSQHKHFVLKKPHTKNLLQFKLIDICVSNFIRKVNSGTHDFVIYKLKIDFSPAAKELNDNAQILKGIKITIPVLIMLGLAILFMLQQRV